MAIEIIVSDEFVDWYSALSEAEQESVRPAVRLLEEYGIALSYPQSSSIRGSKIAMRELRVQHAGEPYRVLYVFDPKRRAVLLLGGNKAGDARWYHKAVARAERLYKDYLREEER